MAGRISAGQEGAPCALTSACLTGLAELAIKRLLPIRLAQPQTTSCGLERRYERRRMGRGTTSSDS